MKEFLKRIKLINKFTIVLYLNRSEFVDQLSAITELKAKGTFLNAFDMFSADRYQYKGRVTYDGFKISQQKRFYDTNMNPAVASGILYEENGQLTSETEINGFNNYFILIYAALFVFYTVFLFGIATSKNNSFIAIPLLFVFLHGTTLFSMLYLIMKRNVKKMKYDLERDFFYLTKPK